MNGLLSPEQLAAMRARGMAVSLTDRRRLWAHVDAQTALLDTISIASGTRAGR